MSEIEIPADIRAAAEAVVERGYNEGLLDAVIRALLAVQSQQRERDAAIADRCAEEWWDYEAGAARRVASLIRGDPAQELVDQAQKLKMGYE